MNPIDVLTPLKGKTDHAGERDHHRSPAVFWLILLALAVLGIAVVLFSTPFGLGLVNDSAAYVGGAWNLMAGNGYVRTSGSGELKPLTHFPPLLSLLLAGLGILGLDVLSAARVVVALLYGGAVFLIGTLIYRLSRSKPFALLGAFLFLISDTFLDVYVYLLSEPLFLALLLASFLLLGNYIRSRRRAWLVATGTAIGLASLTRYIGLSLVITVSLVLWVFGSRQEPGSGSAIARSRRGTALSDTLLLWGVSLLPVLLWFFVSRLALPPGAGPEGETVLGNRTLAWHPPEPAIILEAIKNLLSFLAPDRFLYTLPILGSALSLASLLVLPGLAVYLAWRLKQHNRGTGEGPAREALAFSLALHIPVYLASLIFSLTFLDASTPLNTRILSVVYILELILILAGLAWLWQKAREWGASLMGSSKPGIQRILEAAIVLICLGGLVFTVWDGTFALQKYHQEGLGFAHRGWKQSGAIQAVQQLSGILLYSNRPTGIYLLTGRPAYAVPSPVDAVTTQARETYVNDLQIMQARVRSGEAALVLFELATSQDTADQAWYQDLIDGLPLKADFGRDVVFAR